MRSLNERRLSLIDVKKVNFILRRLREDNSYFRDKGIELLVLPFRFNDKVLRKDLGNMHNIKQVEIWSKKDDDNELVIWQTEDKKPFNVSFNAICDAHVAYYGKGECHHYFKEAES